jgi:hypothetical protein
MSNNVRFNSTSKLTFPAPVSPAVSAFDLPNGDWTIFETITMDGGFPSTFGWVARTAELGVAGGFAIAINSGGGIFLYLNGNGNIGCQGRSNMAAGSSWVVFHHRVNGVVRTSMCPVLSVAPTDGSAVQVTTENTGTYKADLAVALVAAGDVQIGNRNDNARAFNNSLSRFGAIAGTLTPLEMAQMAYGIEVQNLPTPRTPLWYLPLSGPNDLNDVGPLKAVATKTGTINAGTDVPYGYTPAPTAPVFSGNPSVVAPVLAGSAASYTPASASGAPNPTMSQQWTIDGVDVSGATGATYTPATADIGKVLRVRQTATNSAGTVSVTSGGATVGNNAITVGVAELTAERIYQRIGGSAAVALSGTWGGPAAPAKIEYQLYAPDGSTVMKAWADTAATIATDGTWTATPSMPAPTNGKKYRIAVQAKNSSATVIASSGVKTNRFGVGDIIACIGSSSAWTWFQSSSASGLTANHDSISTMSGANWALFGTAGTAITMANYLAQALGVPVAMLSFGSSGETLANWANTGSSRWAGFVTGVANAGGKLGGVFASAGSNDAVNGGWIKTKASHYNTVKNTIDNTRTLTGQSDLPFLWSGMNRRTNSGTISAAEFDLQATRVREAENDIGDYPYVYHVQALGFEIGGDGIHLTAEGFQGDCALNQYVFAQARLGTYRRGPRIDSIVYSGNQVLVTLVHRNGTDFSPATAIPGFTITDSDASGVAPVLQSVVRKDATHILITCDRALSSPVVKFLDGSAPTVTMVSDNGTVALPMVVETEMAAVQGTIAPALATTVSFSVVKDFAGTPADNATGLDYAIYETTRLNANVLPIKYGSNLAISNGVATLDITGATTLTPGGIVRINYGPADGSKIASALVAVS